MRRQAQQNQQTKRQSSVVASSWGVEQRWRSGEDHDPSI